MLRKALTTTVLATVLLTSSISANELATQGFSGSTAKVETIGAFDNIPTQGLSSSELNEKGEFFYLIYAVPYITEGAIFLTGVAARGLYNYHAIDNVQRVYQTLTN